MPQKTPRSIVNITRPLGAFGEVSVIEPQAHVQIDPILGLRDITDVEALRSGTGATACVEDITTGVAFSVQSGTDVGGYGIIRSRRAVRYRPGQGNTFRFTAAFDTPQTNSGQRAGSITVGTELGIGYDGTRFGCLHRTGGRVEIQRLSINTTTGNETATISLNGTDYTVSLTSGNAQHAAYEIAAFSYTGYDSLQNSTTVTFISQAVGDQTGTFALTTTGSVVGTFSEVAAGAPVIDTWIYQEDFNGFRLAGDESSHNEPFVLNPQLGNVYQIQLQYLGYGAITFEVEDPNTGNFITMHRIKYANANTGPSVDVPIFRIGWAAFNTTNTTSLKLLGGSGAAMTDGIAHPFRNPEGTSNSKSNIGTGFTNVLSLRVRGEFKGRLNLAQIFPIIASFAVDGTKPAECSVFLNPTLGGETNWTYVAEDVSIVEQDIAGATVTSNANTIELFSLALGKSGSEQIYMRDFNVELQRFDVLTLAIKATSGTTDGTASITWQED